jgi:tryptophan halogenase
LDNKKIVVLGGGTAGWITALLVKKFYKDYEITLIESEKVGILGAGEGTVSHFISVLDLLNIPVSELVKKCQATIKIGVKFCNWSGDNTSYFHHFWSGKNLEISDHDDYPFDNMIYAYMLGNKIHLDECNFMKKLADVNKVPFIQKNYFDKHQNPICSYDKFGAYSLHFNATSLADYLRSLGISRGIRRIEGQCDNVTQNFQGDITKLHIRNNQEVECDFVFDCSGFSRFILGKVFKEQWKSYKNHLPVDTAVPFFISHNNKNIPPYIKATALKYGWLWETPVIDRYGCGYVYDSSLINEDAAINELETLFGKKIVPPKIFKFDAGSFKNAFVHNCLAVGLSQSFIEPLEATSIWAATLNLINFLKCNGLERQDDKFRNYVNDYHEKIDKEILEFIYVHYLTGRSDTKFWKEFKFRTEKIDSLEYKFKLWNDTGQINFEYLNTNLFTQSWIIVGNGVGLFDYRNFHKISNKFHNQQYLTQKISDLIYSQNQIVDQCITHDKLLEHLSIN